MRKADGALARSASDLAAGERVNLKFKSGDRDAVIDGEGVVHATPPPALKPARPKPTTPKPDQGDLF